ncbi:MAG: ribosome-associated translation inhibitor RaiA [Planctomycetota bacterium]
MTQHTDPPELTVTVAGRHFEVTDAFRAHVEDKAAKLPKFYDRVSQVEAVVSPVDGHAHEVELIAHVDGHEHFVVTARHDEPLGAADLAVEKLTRRLHDYKEQRRNKKHVGKPS